MILDAFQLFANAQDFTGLGTSTQVSSNVLDYGIVSGIPSSANGGGARDMGAADPHLQMLVQVVTAFTGGTSIQVNLQGAVDDTSGSPAAFSTWWSSPVYTVAQLVAGARLYDLEFPRPPQGVAIPRFMRMTFGVIGTMTAGAITAGVVLDRPDQAYSSTNNAVLGGYPAGITVAN